MSVVLNLSDDEALTLYDLLETDLEVSDEPPHIRDMRDKLADQMF